MNYDDDDLPAEDFEGTPEEKMRFEIEMLKLKISAELGGETGSVDDANLPPEIEKQFLEQVLAFHKNKSEAITLRTHLGNPIFPPAESMSEPELKNEWDKVEKFYGQKGIEVGFIAEYPLALRYTFMTGELLDKDYESYGEGFTMNYIYEEFHPNNDHDQRALTNRFLDQYAEGRISEYTVADPIATPNGKTIPLGQVQERLDRFFSMFEKVTDWSYEIERLSCQTDEEMGDGEQRLGNTVGTVRFTGWLSDGTSKVFEGPFQIYMGCRYECWEVVFFWVWGVEWGKEWDGGIAESEFN